MAALADFGGKMDRGLGRRATADVLWDQVSLLSLWPHLTHVSECCNTHDNRPTALNTALWVWNVTSRGDYVVSPTGEHPYVCYSAAKSV